MQWSTGLPAGCIRCFRLLQEIFRAARLSAQSYAKSSHTADECGGRWLRLWSICWRPSSEYSVVWVLGNHFGDPIENPDIWQNMSFHQKLSGSCLETAINLGITILIEIAIVLSENLKTRIFMTFDCAPDVPSSSRITVYFSVIHTNFKQNATTCRKINKLANHEKISKSWCAPTRAWVDPKCSHSDDLSSSMSSISL